MNSTEKSVVATTVATPVVAAKKSTPAATAEKFIPASATKIEPKTQVKAVVKRVAKKAAPVVKTAVKPVIKTVATKPAKPLAKTTPDATIKTVAKTVIKAKPAKPSKEKKPKLVRDSFTIPKAEYTVLDDLKQRAGKLSSAVKKSELIRAGVKALAAMSDASFLAALKAVPAIKTGRPSKAKAG